MHIRRKNMTGSHVRAKSDMNSPKLNASGAIRCPIGSDDRALKPGEDLVDAREADAAQPPSREASRGALLVQAARRVLDERDTPPAQPEPLDRGVVADVGRDAEEDYLVGIEGLEERVRVRVREDVEVLLEQEELAPPAHALGEQARWDRDLAERQRILLVGLRDLLRAPRSAQAVRRIGVPEVGLVRDLRIGELVVV